MPQQSLGPTPNQIPRHLLPRPLHQKWQRGLFNSKECLGSVSYLLATVVSRANLMELAVGWALSGTVKLSLRASSLFDFEFYRWLVPLRSKSALATQFSLVWFLILLGGTCAAALRCGAWEFATRLMLNPSQETLACDCQSFLFLWAKVKPFTKSQLGPPLHSVPALFRYTPYALLKCEGIRLSNLRIFWTVRFHPAHLPALLSTFDLRPETHCVDSCG